MKKKKNPSADLGAQLEIATGLSAEAYDLRSHFEAIIADKEQEAKINAQAVLEVLRTCDTFRQPVPDWAIKYLADAARRYLSAEARTLDEALGLPARGGNGLKWKQPEAAFDAAFGADCWLKAAQMLKETNPGTKKLYSKTDVFDAVAERIGNGATRRKVARNFKSFESMLKAHTNSG